MSLVSEREWRDLVDLYFQVKDLIALAEIVDTDERLCLSAITELRSALDHLMRIQHVTVVEGQTKPLLAATNDDPRPSFPEQEDAQRVYCRSNLQKAKGHIYRAAYDSLDALILSGLSDFEGLTSGFDFDDICEVLPEFPDCWARIDQARSMVVHCKMSKDVEPGESLEASDGKLQENGRVIEQYLLAHKTISDVSQLVRKNGLRIRAVVRRRKREFFRQLLIGGFCSLAVVILVAVSVWLVQFLPPPRVGIEPPKPGQVSLVHPGGSPPPASAPIQPTQ